jgi:hypothetical protein
MIRFSGLSFGMREMITMSAASTTLINGLRRHLRSKAPYPGGHKRSHFHVKRGDQERCVAVFNSARDASLSVA